MGRLTGSRDKRTGRVGKSRSVMSKRVLCGDNNSRVVGDFGRDRGAELETTLDVTEEEVGFREKSRIEMVRKKVIKRCCE
ncbi:hypothetical protein Tco_0665653 [Tanacetum coccineum]